MIQVFLLAKAYLIFQTFYKNSKILGGTEKIVSWKSKGLPAEGLITSTTTDNSLSPSIKWYENSNFCLAFKGSCLKKAQLILLQIEEYSLLFMNLNSDFTF